jgi:hypothetical protein
MPLQTPSCGLDSAANARAIATTTLCPGTLMQLAFPCALVRAGLTLGSRGGGGLA